jgi:hypothetical protein
MDVARNHPGDLNWLAKRMSNQWDYADQNLKAIIWGAAAEAAGISNATIKSNINVLDAPFGPDQWGLVDKGREYYRNESYDRSSGGAVDQAVRQAIRDHNPF